MEATERIEEKPEGKLMVAIFGEKALNLHPSVLVEENGRERTVGLKEAILSSLNNLSRGKNEKDLRQRMKRRRVIELRFGLLDGKPKTRREVGQELFGITRERVRQIEMTAIHSLRHPSRSSQLRRFIV